MAALAPIRRLQNWWSQISNVDINRCALTACDFKGKTFLSKGGYRYCSAECEQADAAAQAEAPF